MGPAALGGEDMLPVLNYICEKTNLNILGSIAYINSFISLEDDYDGIQDQMLRQVSEEA